MFQTPLPTYHDLSIHTTDAQLLNAADPLHHPLPTGFIFESPGKHFTYQIIGPCCQLFDREELPWPCCRIQWHSKEPSWRRIGRRFIADIAAKRCPSYSVFILNQEYSQEPFVLTMYWVRFPPTIRDWWYAKIRTQEEGSDDVGNTER
ncbi:MAG: hypothetical protein AAFR31_02480 [Cyanobacteria bacterium J06627_8]